MCNCKCKCNCADPDARFKEIVEGPIVSNMAGLTVKSYRVKDVRYNSYSVVTEKYNASGEMVERTSGSSFGPGMGHPC